MPRSLLIDQDWFGFYVQVILQNFLNYSSVYILKIISNFISQKILRNIDFLK